MASASVYVPRVSHCYTAIPASPQDSPRPAGRSSPGSYQITAFALGPSACEILCVPLQSEVSISSRPLELPKLSPLAFKVKCSRGYCPPSAGPRLRSYIWGSELSLLWESLYTVIIASLWTASTLWVWDLIILPVHPSYLSHCGSFFMSLVVEDIFW